VGESSGSTSYHLRQLARYGFIEDASAHRGRERVWRYRQRRVILEGGGGGGRELLAELLKGEAYEFDRFLGQRDLPPEWDGGSFLATRALRLTSAELAELRDGVSELLGRFRRAEADDPPADSRPVRVLAFGYPLPLEET
jgi:hypothetical protein